MLGVGETEEEIRASSQDFHRVRHRAKQHVGPILAAIGDTVDAKHFTIRERAVVEAEFIQTAPEAGGRGNIGRVVEAEIEIAPGLGHKICERNLLGKRQVAVCVELGKERPRVIR